jgi:hypothetical protein
MFGVYVDAADDCQMLPVLSVRLLSLDAMYRYMAKLTGDRSQIPTRDQTCNIMMMIAFARSLSFPLLLCVSFTASLPISILIPCCLSARLLAVYFRTVATRKLGCKATQKSGIGTYCCHLPSTLREAEPEKDLDMMSYRLGGESSLHIIRGTSNAILLPVQVRKVLHRMESWGGKGGGLFFRLGQSNRTGRFSIFFPTFKD